jgi:hypothetical protein
MAAKSVMITFQVLLSNKLLHRSQDLHHESIRSLFDFFCNAGDLSDFNHSLLLCRVCKQMIPAFNILFRPTRFSFSKETYKNDCISQGYQIEEGSAHCAACEIKSIRGFIQSFPEISTIGGN